MKTNKIIQFSELFPITLYMSQYDSLNKVFTYYLVLLWSSYFHWHCHIIDKIKEIAFKIFKSAICYLLVLASVTKLKLRECDSVPYKNGTIEAMHHGHALRKIDQQKWGSNLWKHLHFEASIKGFLMGISLPNLVTAWNHIPNSKLTQKCGSRINIFTENKTTKTWPSLLEYFRFL